MLGPICELICFDLVLDPSVTTVLQIILSRPFLLPIQTSSNEPLYRGHTLTLYVFLALLVLQL